MPHHFLVSPKEWSLTKICQTPNWCLLLLLGSFSLFRSLSLETGFRIPCRCSHAPNILVLRFYSCDYYVQNANLSVRLWSQSIALCATTSPDISLAEQRALFLRQANKIPGLVRPKFNASIDILRGGSRTG